jgi:hypothetical protein
MMMPFNCSYRNKNEGEFKTIRVGGMTDTTNRLSENHL